MIKVATILISMIILTLEFDRLSGSYLEAWKWFQFCFSPNCNRNISEYFIKVSSLCQILCAGNDWKWNEWSKITNFIESQWGSLQFCEVITCIFEERKKKRMNVRNFVTHFTTFKSAKSSSKYQITIISTARVRSNEYLRFS